MATSKPTENSSIVSENRRLAAVLFVDMVGYSAIMQRDQVAAQNAVDTLWSLFTPLVERHGGTQVRRFGDGMLLTFGGALPAVRCVLELMQTLLAHNQSGQSPQPIRIRCGLHIGDIGDRVTGEIFGDGVNIASRLESLAPHGGLAISPHVRDQLHNVLDHPVKSLGLKSLKNIAEPMEVFCLPGPECTAADLDAALRGGEIPARRWRFGAASFDERARELSIGGHVVPLGREPLEALRYLLLHAGEVVTEQELCEAAGLAEVGQLDEAIGALREALRDSDASQIKTQTGYGYRLAVAVAVDAAPTAQLTKLEFMPGDRPPLRPLWSLKSMLGQGGHGEVWLAEHDKTREKRVYKFALDPQRLASLKREITLSRVLQDTVGSEYFIRVLDWNLDLAPYFVECEYGGSCDLIAWAEQHGGLDQIPMGQRLDLLASVAEALAAAHLVGVLHKDLKPANVLIDDRLGGSQTVKIIDFGSGGVLNPQHLDEVGITRMGFTQSVALEIGSSSGTPLYIAPEVLQGKLPTVRGDVYALGVMLYQLVVGDLRKPLAAGWEADVADELLREDIAYAAHGNPDLRQVDAASFAQGLRSLDQRRAQREAEREEKRQAERARQDAEQARQALQRLHQRRRWAAALIVALVAGLGLSLYQQQRAQEAESQAVAAAEEAEAARAASDQAAREAQAVAAFLSQDLFAQVSEKPLATLTVPELLLNAARSLDARENQLPQVAAQLHASLGSALVTAERYIDARRQFQAALDKYELAGQLGSVEAARVARQWLPNSIGLPNVLKKDIQRANVILTHARQRLGAGAAAVVDLQVALAQAQFFSGEWRRSVGQYQEAIEQLDATGTLLVETELARIRLAQLHIIRGEFKHATEILEYTLDQNVELNHPVVAYSALAFLCHARAALERFSEAESAWSEAEGIAAEWTLPGSNVVRASIELAKGLIAYHKGDFGAAIVAYERAIEAFSTIHEQGSVQRDPTGSFRVWLSQAFAGTEQFDRALREMTKAIQLLSLEFGEDNPRVTLAKLALAEIHWKSGDVQAARRSLANLNNEHIEELGRDNVNVARLRRLEGLLALGRGESSAALKALQIAADGFESTFGANHSRSLRARKELAMVQAR